MAHTLTSSPPRVVVVVCVAVQVAIKRARAAPSIILLQSCVGSWFVRMQPARLQTSPPSHAPTNESESARFDLCARARGVCVCE